MALNTEISWCDHTLNLWWGCVKVSPGCKHCYADTLDNRYHHGDKHWGPGSTRHLVRSWKKNLNDMRKSAIKAGRRETVFVMSMGDIFEDDQPLSNNHGTPWTTTDLVRQEFFKMIPDYPELIFLLLTKRPENIAATIPQWWDGDPPFNVWFGTSIVNQEEVYPRIFALSIQAPSWNMFVSMEPLLGPVTLNLPFNAVAGQATYIEHLAWIIVGGESGQKARPMNPDWARLLRDEARQAIVPFHFKQWGEHGADGKKVGKMAAGKTLDGEILQAFPPEFHAPLGEKVTS
jgi:protein gp37